MINFISSLLMISLVTKSPVNILDDFYKLKDLSKVTIYDYIENNLNLGSKSIKQKIDLIDDYIHKIDSISNDKNMYIQKIKNYMDMMIISKKTLDEIKINIFSEFNTKLNQKIDDLKNYRKEFDFEFKLKNLKWELLKSDFDLEHFENELDNIINYQKDVIMKLDDIIILANNVFEYLIRT